MKRNKINIRIVFIGAGNLATNLAPALKNAGCKIIQVIDKTIKSAEFLAKILDCSYTGNIKNADLSADIYFFTVPDNSLVPILSSNIFNNKFLVHCAGSLPLNIFKQYTTDYGVFYPFHTFLKFKPSDFSNIPLCVETSSIKNLKILSNLAEHVSKKVYILDSEKRFILHIAGIFACNFSNYFYTIAKELLEREQLSFEMLKPVIAETAGRISEISPEDAQTGPARRNDYEIINKHIEYLKNYPYYRDLYAMISQGITNHYKRKSRK
ncbi:MAG: DUF2520 domain-containing protein [Bacteroidia bacterium]|nr:DUF2520 domain-containing protein [Bacteroidia bacterium]